ncbi:CPBP family intramembrane glutamic endopeptidase [Nocardia carnea]|uniref:CPBP family intramembrane glutamic endopeptidase n=1 Tax=Nocardia carnea TaxID=37328 RepID=UPI0024558071|nr:CPBP family intramembrane metalloprotease [Nocardia carnea]
MTTVSTAREPVPRRTVPQRRGIRWFLLLTFAGAWIPWGIAGVAGYSLDDPVVQLLTGGAFVPALAAVITRRWITREGFVDAGLRLRLGRQWRSYVVAALLPLGVLAAALALAVLLGLWHPEPGDFGSAAVLFLVLTPMIPVVAAPIFFGEEFGWTAYLRDRLLPGRPVATTFATGLIWGIWHWPLPWVGYLGAGGSATDAFLAMLMWLPLSIELEFLIGWLWARSGSVWPAAVLHGGSNLVLAAGLEVFVGDAGPSGATTTLLMCAAYSPVVAWIVVTTRLGVPRQPRPAAEAGP